jgi:hypothetical protein
MEESPMADDKIDITSFVTDAIKAVTDSVAPAKKTTAKKTTAKKASTTKKASTAKKTATAKKTTAKKASTTKKTSTAKKTTTKKATTTKSTTKKVGKIIFEIDHRQIDIDAIKKKAAKLGGDVYVVTSEKKIYDSNGKSINLF